MKKIAVDKGDGIAEVIDAILAVDDSDVVLHIPKGSALAKSASNFRLLKREVDLAEKNVTVESADEKIQELAKDNDIALAGAAAVVVKHPHGANSLSDVIEKTEPEDGEREETQRGRKTVGVKLTVRDESDVEDEKPSFFGSDRFFKDASASKRPVSHDDDDEDDEDESGGGSGKVWAWSIGILILVAVVFYAVTIIFGHAEVTIDFTKTPWSVQSNFVADKTVSAFDATTNTIPAQVFTTQKNITQLFPATGQNGNVSVKAQGTITIYNDYSAAPQDLVATTRFVTPDGKIFRLTTDVTVPGAQVANGVTTPSSITAPIVADQGGPAYNVGPVTKLTIPGFQNSPAKYAGFYGAITGQTTGGFTGARTIPTAADIANARASTTAILQADLQGGLTASYPGNFKILDGATDIVISKLIVSTSTDANGNFSVFGEASLTAIGFDESALESDLLMVATTAANGGPTQAFKSVNLSYANVQANFPKGQLSFALSGQGVIEPAFSASDFASSIAGKSIGAARDDIQALPQLSDGSISVWPSWLWSMPSSPQKIQVTAN